MALSNWFNSNIVIDISEFKEINRNISEYSLDEELNSLDEGLNFEIYKNFVQIRLNNGKKYITFDEESSSEITIGSYTFFVQPGSFPSEMIYFVYDWEKKILIIGICGIDNLCNNCGVMSIGKKLQDIFMALLNVKTINILEKDKENKMYELIKSMTFYNQGGRKYDNLLANEDIETFNEYEN